MILLSLTVTSKVLYNFHVVTDGVVYRSAQLNPHELEKVVTRFKIKSILNLRGPSAGSDWYDAEMRITRQLGVVHYDLNLSANRYVPVEELKKVVVLIDAAPKPILIHCNGGADRTGLICAVWKFTAEHVSPDSAVHQLSVLYGHFPYLLWSDSVAMDKSFADFVKTAN